MYHYAKYQFHMAMTVRWARTEAALEYANHHACRVMTVYVWCLTFRGKSHAQNTFLQKLVAAGHENRVH